MDYRNDNKRWWWVFVPIAIITLLLAGSLALSSCSPAKRATNKVYRAVRIDRPAAGKACGDIFPPIDSIHTERIYIQGEPVVTVDTFTDYQTLIINDTVYRERTRYVEKKITDTVNLSTFERSSYNAKLAEMKAIEDKLRKDLEASRIKIGKLYTTIDYLLWAAIILGAYTLIRIIARIWFPALSKFLI